MEKASKYNYFSSTTDPTITKTMASNDKATKAREHALCSSTPPSQSFSRRKRRTSKKAVMELLTRYKNLTELSAESK